MLHMHTLYYYDIKVTWLHGLLRVLRRKSHDSKQAEPIEIEEQQLEDQPKEAGTNRRHLLLQYKP
jgi:hypothetical protein